MPYKRLRDLRLLMATVRGSQFGRVASNLHSTYFESDPLLTELCCVSGTSLGNLVAAHRAVSFPEGHILESDDQSINIVEGEINTLARQLYSVGMAPFYIPYEEELESEWERWDRFVDNLEIFRKETGKLGPIDEEGEEGEVYPLWYPRRFHLSALNSLERDHVDTMRKWTVDMKDQKLVIYWHSLMAGLSTEPEMVVILSANRELYGVSQTSEPPSA